MRREQDDQPVGDIGKRLLLETNTITLLLQWMERIGMITRTRGKEDTRQRIVSLTQKGKVLEQDAIRVQQSMHDIVATDEKTVLQVVQMMPILDQLIKELNKLNEQMKYK